LYRDSRGTLWVGTRGEGVARMVNGRFEKVPVVPRGPITALLEGPDHSLWMAAFGGGVFRLQNGTLTTYTVNDGLPDNRVTELFPDHSGTLWTLGWKGISSWNGPRFIPRAAVNAVVSYAISCIEDRDGNLWIGASTGLYRVRGTEVTSIERGDRLSSDFVSN